MSSSRPRVSAALHEELTEYSSLLRALRTSNTLDLAAQLTAPRDDDGESEKPTTDSVTSTSTRSKRKQDDGWTRWPLLAGDVHVPEWTLEDEVKLLAVQALQQQRAPAVDEEHPVAEPAGTDDAEAEAEEEAEDVDDGDDGDDELNDPELHHSDPDVDHDLPAPYLTSLTHTVAHRLSHLLALLAAHVPPREASMQNRLRPVAWRTVLDVAAVHGLLSQEAVERLRTRLHMLYPEPELEPAETQTQHVFKDDTPLRRACAAHDLSFLSIDGRIHEPTVRKMKRGPYKKRKRLGDGDQETEAPGPSTRSKRRKTTQT